MDPTICIEIPRAAGMRHRSYSSCHKRSDKINQQLALIKSEMFAVDNATVIVLPFSADIAVVQHLEDLGYDVRLHMGHTYISWE